MKNRLDQQRTSALLAGAILALTHSAAHAQTYVWDQQAVGQPYEYCQYYTAYYPSNSSWNQALQTNQSCNGPGNITSAPPNWDPAPPVGLFPGGAGLQGVDVVLDNLLLGEPGGVPGTNYEGTYLNTSITLNSLIIRSNAVLTGFAGNVSLTVNYLEFQGDGTFGNGSGGGVKLENGGTMLKSGGTNAFFLDEAFSSSNATIEVDVGTLVFPLVGNAILTGDTTLIVSNDATLLLTTSNVGGPFLSGNITGAGGGTVLIDDGAPSSTGCNLSFPSNMLQWAGGSLKSGPWTNSGVVNISTYAPQLYGGCDVYNYNLLNLADNSSLSFFSPGGAAPGLFNEVSGTFNIQGDSSIVSGDGSIYNYGLFIKTAGAGISQITPIFDNYGGTVEADAGTLELNLSGGGYISNATFVVSNGATIDLITSNYNMEIEGALTGTGGGTVLMSAGTLSSYDTTTFNFPGAMFQWAGGKLGDDYANNVSNINTMNVSGPVGIDGYFGNNGTMIQSGTGAIVNGNNFYNYTNAVYDMQNDGGVSVGNFYNYGLLEKNGGTNISVISSYFYNYGPGATVDVGVATLALTGVNNLFSNTSFSVNSGATLVFAPNNANYSQEMEGATGGSGGGSIVLSNGLIFSAGPATLSFPGSMFQWQGGKIGSSSNPSTLTNIGVINVVGPVALNHVLANSGSMIQSGAGSIGSGDDFYNDIGGVYNIQNDGGLSISDIYNYGLLEKTGGTNTSFITANFYNYGPIGAVVVDSGTMAFAGANFYSTNTSFVVNNGATLVLSTENSANYNLDMEGASSASGGGTVLLTNASVSSSYPATLNFPGSMFQWQGGKIGSSSNPSTLTNIGVINVAAPVALNHVLANSGSMIQSGAGSIGSGDDFYNDLGGVYNIQNDGGLSISDIYNYGLLEKTGGTNTSFITANFYNYGPMGAVVVDSGTMAFAGVNFYSTNTSFVVSNGATLVLSTENSANYNLDMEGASSASGGGTVLLTNATIECSSPATLNFPGSMFQWLGGRIGNSANPPVLTNIGVINVGGSVAINSGLANTGTMIQSGAGSIGGNNFYNYAGATYDIQNDHGVSISDIYNYGLLEKTAGSSTSLITGNFFNWNSIQAPSGAMAFTNGTFTQNAGTLQLSAAVSIQSSIVENGGTITGVGAMGFNNGDVSMAVNGGVLAPGNPAGALSFLGHYGFSMGSAAAFNVVLAGPNTNQFSQLQVPNSSATVAGTLNVQLGYLPPIGSQFQIISSAGRGGAFSTLNVPQGISVTYSNNGVFLVVTNTVTSAVPLPVDISNPIIINTNSNTNFSFSFPTQSNITYIVQQNTDLATTNWAEVTNFIGNGSNYLFFTPVTNIPALFFRILEP